MANQVADRIAAVAARIATVFGPRTMRVIARLNRYVTNPVVMLVAPRVRHMAVIEHHGRKSGRSYATPVMAFVEDGHISVVLNYGAKSDWVRNVGSAGSAFVVHHSSRYALSDPQVLPLDSPALPEAVRAVGVSARSVFHGTVASVGS
jgi:deazaflavin-dependent oxidoreductase (nitroreductase family)